MRFVKVFCLILFFFVSMMFFMQNTETLTQRMPLQLDLFIDSLRFLITPMPVYFLVLLSFLVGALFTLTFFLVERIRLSKIMQQKNAKLASLEQEVASLRNLPLEDKMAASANISSSTPSLSGSSVDQGA
jgi:hypothetical protein